MARPDDSDEMREVSERVEEAREEAIEAAESAESSTPHPSELLFHPDHVPDADSPHPYGVPGPPISRHAPFYVGFVGGLGVLTALLIGIALRQVSSILVIILVSFFLAVGLNPIVEFLMHRGFRRPWAVFVVSLGVLGVVAVFVVSLIPVLQDQITTLIDNLPAYLDDFRKKQWVQDIDNKYDVIGTVQDKVQNADFAQTAFGSIFSVGLAVLSALFNAFLIFVLTLYLLASLPKLKQSAYQLAPASRRTRVTYLGDEILRQVGGYVAGQFLVAVCAGVSSFIFLEIVGLGKYAVALALVVAILDLIPLIGATIGASVVILIAFANGVGMGIACLIFYVAYQQFENYVLYPRIMRSSVDVPGVLTVVAVLIGGGLMGVVGAILAIPTAAAILLLVREIFLRKQDST